MSTRYKKSARGRETHRKWAARHRAKIKKEVIALFGGGCRVCGFSSHHAALQIDHRVPILRKNKTAESGSALWARVWYGKRSTSGLQLLCANCHAIKTFETDRVQFEQKFKSNHTPTEQEYFRF